MDYLRRNTLRVSLTIHIDETIRAGIHRGARTKNQGHSITVQSLRAINRIRSASTLFMVLKVFPIHPGYGLRGLSVMIDAAAEPHLGTNEFLGL